MSEAPERMATIGQLTSRIANKQVRSEKYGQLKHKQKVCTGSSPYPCRSESGSSPYPERV